jgi:hypothetical protein
LEAVSLKTIYFLLVFFVVFNPDLIPVLSCLTVLTNISSFLCSFGDIKLRVGCLYIIYEGSKEDPILLAYPVIVKSRLYATLPVFEVTFVNVENPFALV